MTLPTSTRVTDPYETDGVQRDFEFDFPAFYNADTGHYGIEVRRLTALDYEVIDKSLYDIFLNDEDKSGYVRFHVAPMAGDDIYIAGDTTRSQQLNLINYGRYSAQSIEKAFDLIVALIQEFVSKVDEETRQRILADQALRDFLLIKFNQFTAEVTTKIDKHIGDINGFMSSLIPMFVCIMRKEIAYYAETQLDSIIDAKLSDLSTQVANAIAENDAALIRLNESILKIDAATTATAIGARLFDTAAAGVHPVTGVPAGSYFNVRSPNADSYVDEYRNVGGVPTPSGKSYPSGAAVNAIAADVSDAKEAIEQVNADLVAKTNKLKPKKILLQDYVMPAHNGNASLALSLAIADAKLKSSCTIDFEFYEYDFKTLVNESNLNNIKLDASDAVIRNTTGLSEVIRLSNCSNTRWILDVVEGIETLARHTTIGANFYYFLRFVNSKNCRVHGANSKSIRSLVEFYDCIACKAYDNYHVGFLPEIAETQIANTNYLPFITFNGGRHNLAWGNHAENHGSDVLWGREAFATIAFGNSGKHLHDNGIYGSSGNNSISFGNSFDYVRGTGIKPRGSRNLAIGNTLSNAYTGVSSTGNGVTVDSLGANGFGNITAFNAIDKSVNYSVSVGIQDSLYSRGAIVAFNVSGGHLGVGNYSPYAISSTHAAVTVGNILDEHNADLGFLVTGLADRSLNNSGVFALNSGHTTKPLARSTYGQNSVYLGNVNSNGQGVQFRYQLNSVAVGNNALTQAVIQSDTYLSENMLYVGNGGIATNLANATTIVEGNANLVQNISSATLLPLPKRSNIIARDELGNPYVSVLIGSTYSWKKITTT